MNDLLHSFPGQQNNETVFVFARPDPLSFLPVIGVFVFVLLFSFLAQYVILSDVLVVLPSSVVTAGLALIGIFQLIILVAFIIAVMDFYLNIVIVTNRRLVDIDQEQLFLRRISELDLEEIEDVTSVVKGVLPTLFNYGTVLIQTAGSQENFSMDNIRFPREVAALTLNLSEQVKKSDIECPVPQTDIIGVIHNQPIHNLSQLQQVGAMSADPQAPPLNASQ